jgi:hypothetical protein
MGILPGKNSQKGKSRPSGLLVEQKQPSLVIGTLAEYFTGCGFTLQEAAGREIMSTQNAIFNGNQNVSDNGQERERTLQAEETGTRIDEIGAMESSSSVHIPHHRTCCCESCWSKNMNLYL